MKPHTVILVLIALLIAYHVGSMHKPVDPFAVRWVTNPVGKDGLQVDNCYGPSWSACSSEASMHEGRAYWTYEGRAN